MSIRFAIVVLLTCVATNAALCQSQIRLPSSQSSPPPNVLDRQMPPINFTNVTLKQALDFLGEVTGANIYVNWRAIEAANVPADTQVNVKVQDVALSKVLTMVLDDAAGKKGRLDFAADQNVITITTVEELKKNTVVKVYDVTDILGMPTGEAAADPAQQTPTPPQQKRIDVLVKLIVETIDPESWSAAGGTGSIKYLRNQVVISQTPKNHKAITALLNGLRELR